MTQSSKPCSYRVFSFNITISYFRELNFSLTFAPMSLFKWQIYAAQSMRNKWYNFMSEMNEDDEDQDSLKVSFFFRKN